MLSAKHVGYMTKETPAPKKSAPYPAGDPRRRRIKKGLERIQEAADKLVADEGYRRKRQNRGPRMNSGTTLAAIGGQDNA